MMKCITLAALTLTLLAIPVSSASAGIFFHRSNCRPVYRSHYHRTHFARRVWVAPTCVTQPVVVQPTIVYPSCVPAR